MESLGAEALVHFSLDATPVTAVDAPRAGDGSLDEGVAGTGDFVARVESNFRATTGERRQLSVASARLEFFDLESGDAIRD